MLNIPKENIKTFFAIFGGLVFLLVISIIIDVFFLHRSVFNKEKEKNVDMSKYINRPESNFEENKYEMVSEQRRILYYTDEIMEMINNKEFDKLYNILDEEYRSIYAKSIDDLETKMSRFADTEYNLAYDEYYKEGNMFLIDARFEKADLTREEIINGTSYPIDTICIKESKKGKYTVAFNSFIDKKEINQEVSNELVKINVDYMIIKANVTEVVVKFQNLTEENLKLYENKMNIALSHGGLYTRYVDPNTVSSELKPKEEIVCRLRFKNIYAHSSAPKKLQFKKIYTSPDDVKKIEINLQ